MAAGFRRIEGQSLSGVEIFMKALFWRSVKFLNRNELFMLMLRLVIIAV